jgi:hypothetical protein
MFVNLETCDFKESLRGPLEDHLRAITVDILQRTDPSVAVGKIADALQQLASEQPVPVEPMHASLYALAVARIDYQHRERRALPSGRSGVPAPCPASPTLT